MRRWRSIVLIGLLVLGIAAVYRYRQEFGLALPGRRSTDIALFTSAAHPARITWQRVDRSTEGFKLEMPVDAKSIQIPAYNETGGADPVDMIFSNADAETTFSVAWSDNPPVVRVNGRSPERILNMARDEELARTQTTLVTETRSTPGGFPARDLLAQNAGGGVMDSRLIYTGDRLYMLIAAFPSMGARREQDVVRFYNSFKTIASAHSAGKPSASGQ